MRPHRIRFSGAVIAAALLIAPAAHAASDGERVYMRCAACHLKSGAGVPGAYPPLNADVRALAAMPEGRRYIALAVIKGLSGPITVEGKPYRGMMPPQAGLSDEDVAAVLNHVTGTVAKAGKPPKPFTAAEIKAIRAGGAGLNPASVARMQPKLAGK